MIDDVVAGVLVDAIATTGRWLGVAAQAALGRRGADDLAVARWFDTYRLTAGPPELTGLPAGGEDRLAACLRSNGVQAVLHELLAARLTDAPEADVERIQALFSQTLAVADNGLVPVAGTLFGFYDGQIADLTGRLEGTGVAILGQIRQEAFAARLIAVLQAIERHTAALSAGSAGSHASFLTGYRRHVREHHGYLTPPDFEQRRRIPLADLYVPPLIVPMAEARSTVNPAETEPPVIKLPDFIAQIDRSVLLGDPGGGKTTATTAVMHHLASQEHGQIPFLITLREFATTVPPERSVVGHIEHNLDVFYQCPAPPGLIARLLLTGNAVVLFDGLDELLDTSQRAEVTAIVERFCTEYPLAPVLVTSRLVGYDQARLDDRQFSRYRLGGFAEEQVREYAEKWFSRQEDRLVTREDWAESFMQESGSVPDLRSNPLILALMCLLYRGEGSLPHSRAGVYEQCANLLFRRWDSWRRIRVEMRAASFLYPLLRHLAWWLFTRDETQSAVTEPELVSRAAAFLHGRGFECETEAREVAQEFVSLCRDRLWVFSDTGSTATGQVLYSFTHRTFLEYFSAGQLTSQHDTPEQLAAALTGPIARQEWEVVSELAAQIKSQTSDRGADRIYSVLLHQRRHRSQRSRSNILQYLARSLRSVEPSPGIVRELSQDVLDNLFSGSANESLNYLPLSWLIASRTTHRNVISDEIGKRIDTMIASADPAVRLNGLLLASWLPYAPWAKGFPVNRPMRYENFWYDAAKEKLQMHSKMLRTVAADETELRFIALVWKIIDIGQALQLPGGITPLLRTQQTSMFDMRWGSYLAGEFRAFVSNPAAAAAATMGAVGRFLARNPQTPWVSSPIQEWAPLPWWYDPKEQQHPPSGLEPDIYLGAAAILLIFAEDAGTKVAAEDVLTRLGPLTDVAYYILRRRGEWSATLPDLPVPANFQHLFLSWARGSINFVVPGETPQQAAGLA